MKGGPGLEAATSPPTEHHQRAGETELTRRPVTDPTVTVDLALLIDELPEDQRVAFVLTQILGHSYDHAAALCDCPAGTIRSRVARARAALARWARDQLAG